VRKKAAVWPLAACAILSVAAFSWAAGRSTLTLALLGLVLVASLLGERLPIPRLLLFLLTALAGLILFSILPPAPAGHTFIQPVDRIAYSLGLLLSMLLITMLARKNEPGERLFAACTALLLLMTAGFTIEVQPFIFFVLSELLFLMFFLREALPPPARPAGPSRRLIPYIGAALLALLLAAGLPILLAWSESKVSYLISFYEPPLSGSAAFSPKTTLTSIDQMMDSRKAVMRITADNPPLFLVGRRYVRYRKRSWESISRRTTMNPAADGLLEKVFSEKEVPLYLLRTVSPNGKTPVLLKVEMTTTSHGTLFLPDDAFAAEVPLNLLKKDPCGVFFFEGRTPFPGRYRVARRIGLAAGEENDPALLSTCLGIPPDLSDTLLKLAGETTLDLPSKEMQAEAIQRFFHENFTYGRGHAFSTPEDPMLEFLIRRPRAHCEFFAAGMALMLRSIGIPSRYVTGFLVREQNRLGGFYTVRERDAHAWVEAYFPRRGWVSYDPTPPSALALPQPSLFSQAIDLAMASIQRVMAFLVQSPRVIMRQVLSAIRDASFWLSEKPWRLGILVLILIVLVTLPGKRSNLFNLLRMRKKAGASGEAPPVLRMQELLERLDALLKKRGHPRPENLTLREWEQRLKDIPPDFPDTEAARSFLARYALVRYSRPLPEEADLKDLESLLEKLE